LAISEHKIEIVTIEIFNQLCVGASVRSPSHGRALGSKKTPTEERLFQNSQLRKKLFSGEMGFKLLFFPPREMNRTD
jgi:hypothetical protein